MSLGIGRHTALQSVLVLALAILPTLLLFVPAHSQENKKQPDKKICLTFNELPAAETFEETDVEALNFLVLETLKRHEAPAAGFIVGQNIDTHFDILGQWLNDGHVLGSMTFSHQDLHELSIEQFIDDIRRGTATLEDMLQGFGQERRYFRFPFLHYGMATEMKREVRAFLDHHNNTIAHATIVPEDYLYNLTLEKLGKEPDTSDYFALMNEYLNHVIDEVERAERLAMELVDRPVKQILLLRLNRLNAIYLDDLLHVLSDMGYEFISLDEALSDEIYYEPEGYFGGRGVGYLDMIYLSDPDRIPAR